MILRQKFSKPMSGYWNGTPSTFDWHIESRWPDVTRISSWQANYYFPVATGVSDKATLGNARRALRARAAAAGKECEFEYMED